MGTVALVGKDDYNLKITGTVSESIKDGGYLYGNNAKNYDMVLTITNISENKCKSSVCTISTDDENLNLSSETNLQGFTISTLASGATKTLNLKVSYGNLSEPYINTGINIKITNSSSDQEWIDYIPLRFFKGTIPITISAKNPEDNKNAALNGFVIYPDGNNQFFAIPHNTSKPIYVPTFGNYKLYKLVFSGATVTSKLDDSTEMYYTIEPGSLNPRTVVTEGDAQELIEYMNFGGDNHSEKTAYSVTQGFESYLSEGEIDYYTISADSDYYYSADAIPLFSVSYENEKGTAPETILVKAGSTLTAEQLPELECEGFEFLGWYDGEKKVAVGDKVGGNVMLRAGWKKVFFIISFETEYGDVPESITVHEGIILDSNILPLLDDKEFLFSGWYDGDSQVQVGKYNVNKDVTLTAKWYKKCLITYVSEYGKVPDAIVFGSGNQLTEKELPKLSENNCVFLGWYTEPNYVNDTKMSLGQTLTNNQVLYAKWYKMSDLTNEVIILPPGTNGSAGTDATYVLFGNWPQTVKDSHITLDATQSEKHGMFTYCLGSDGYWYINSLENANSDSLECTYSNGTKVSKKNTGSYKYFKVEPIKWRVLTYNYNDTGKALLLAESILMGNIPFSMITNNRLINSSSVYPNNYMYSTIRAYLNGSYENDDTQTISYANNGFLQSAFTDNAQSLISITTVDNTESSTIDSENNLTPAKDYVCQNTKDSIFLLSEKEVTTATYGFSSSNSSGIDNTRIRCPTDYALAHNICNAKNNFGRSWWLRSPFDKIKYVNNSMILSSRVINFDGSANALADVSYLDLGIVPALTISLSD